MMRQISEAADRTTLLQDILARLCAPDITLAEASSLRELMKGLLDQPIVDHSASALRDPLVSRLRVAS